MSAAFRPRITVVDHGLSKLAQTLAGKGARVRVGILEDAPKKPPKHDPEKVTTLTLLEIAAVHEFGAPEAGIPQRSFIRGTVDEKLPDIHRAQAAVARQIISGKIAPAVALDRIGSVVKGLIQQRISAGIDPPNADSTVEAKGSSKPLIDTGQLRSSIAYKVEVPK